jgi:uncharacterized protein YndB with AHSA1/START domain
MTPLRREIAVPASPAVAFRVFVEQIGRWWPLEELSVFGDRSRVGFEGSEGGEIVETGPDGQRSVWGSVTSWRPGEEVAFTWHPGRDAENASRVSVTFRPVADQTLVSLVHSGWEVFADPAAARAEYDTGWAMVLDRYVTAGVGAAA